MKCYDSSFVIDYLDGSRSAIEYLEAHVDEPRYIPSVVLFELYQGELFSRGPPQFERLQHRLGWADPVPFTATTALETGVLLDELATDGRALTPRDAMIAGTARELGATLVTSDGDLTNDELRSVLDVDTY